jgi:hypothetical protein
VDGQRPRRHRHHDGLHLRGRVGRCRTGDEGSPDDLQRHGYDTGDVYREEAVGELRQIQIGGEATSARPRPPELHGAAGEDAAATATDPPGHILIYDGHVKTGSARPNDVHHHERLQRLQAVLLIVSSCEAQCRSDLRALPVRCRSAKLERDKKNVAEQRNRVRPSVLVPVSLAE